MKKLFTILILLLLWAGSSWAAVNTYSFASSAGTYTAITGGTVLVTGTSSMDSWASTAQTIPSFTFNGVAYTTAYVTSNGIITLGATAASSSSTTGISSTVGSGIAICPFSADLDRATLTAATEIRWETVGSEIVFQWTQVKRYAATESFDMQARLNTSSGTVVFVYKINTGPGTGTSYFPQVGIRTSATDYKNRLVASGTEDWATSLPGVTNASTCRFTSTAPAKGFTTGLTFTFTPPVPCIAPVSQPTALLLTPATTVITGSFTAASGSDSYLVVRSTDAVLTTPPVNGTTYAPAAVLGNGVVVSGLAGNTFTASSLTAGTLYYFTVYSMNSACSGGPLYLTTTPLEGSTTTAPVDPATFTATAAGATQINLAATANAGGSTIMVAWNSTNTFGTPSGALSVGNTIAGGGTVLYMGTAASLTNHTGLTAGTAYYYKVWSYAGTAYSNPGLTANAITFFSTPYPQDFNAALTIPTGWLSDMSVSATHGASASNGLYRNLYSSTLTTYATSPVVTLSASPCQVRFEYRIVNYTGYPATGTTLGASDKIDVLLSTDGGLTFPTTLYTINSTNHVTSASFALKTISLSTYSGNIRIKLLSTWGAGDYYVDIDNFVVEEVPSCTLPSGLAISAITTTGASIGWVGATNVQIDYGSAGHAAGTGTSTGTVSANPYGLSGLTSNTSYDVFIRQDCGSGVYSAWYGPTNFRTLCDPATSISENFDAVTVPALPGCWNKISTYTFGTATTISTTSVSAPNCAQLYNGGAAVTDNILLIAPKLSNLSAHTNQLVFSAKSSSTLATTVIVGTMTDPANAATFTPFQTIAINSTAFTQAIVSFATYSGTDTYIAFRHPCQTTYSNIYIDDVSWVPLPTCPQPIDLAVSEVTLTSANLTWTPGNVEEAWEYVYGVSPLAAPTGAGTATSSSKVNPITGLTAATTYQYYVRANCGAEFSLWSGPVSFFTGYCTPAPTSVDGSGITNVTFGLTPAIVNNTTVAEVGNYGNYSAMIGDVQRTVSTNVAITFATGYTYDTKIWVDWNDNLSFLDAGEEVYVGTSLATNPTTLVASFIVPVTATLGNHRMRIGGVDAGPPTPCYASSYGTFEDYTINVLVAPACLPPTALTATGITTTSANLTWTPGGTETAWEYVFGVSPVPAPTGAGTATTSNTVNPVTLVASTTYQYFVRSNCGASLSAWSGPYTFSSPCGTVAVPYTENFDGVIAPAIPNCMSVIDGNADVVKWVTSTLVPRSAPNCMRIGYNSSADMDDWFFTPALALTVGVYKVSFWYHSSGASFPEKLEVKWGAAPSAAGMTNGPVFDNNNIISSTYAEGTATLTVTAAGDYYVGFHGYSDMDMYYLVVDDIHIYKPLDHDVSTVSLNNITSVVDLTPTTPKATVKNEGANTETFTVTTTIGSYTSTKTVTALAPGASTTVTFDLWTPTVGSFTATTCTNLGSDQLLTNNCVSVTGSAFNYTRFYSYIAYAGTGSLPEGPGYFYKEAPGTLVSLAPTTSDQFICAGTWASGKWFASEYYDPDLVSGGGWYTIDPSDGAMTKAADLGRSFTGITYDHTTNTMYGVDYDDVALINNLYTIDKSTGAATLLGTVAAGELLINLATDGSGFLYSLGISTDHLFKINTVGTPVATDLGSAGILMSYAQDMEYDYASSTMYAPAYLTASTSGLYTVDLTTGACTLVAALAGNAELCGFAIPYTDSKTLNLTSVFLEGLYAGNGTMNTAALHEPAFPAGVADLITIELRNADYTLATSFPDVQLSTTGTATVSVPSAYSGSYHITIRHRNSIETTTLAPVSFAGSTMNEAFTVGNVYGGNLGLMAGPGTYYAIYAGDVDQNGTVDSGDFTPVDNDASNYLSGYLATDVNGDGGIDTGDFTAVDNNGLNYVSTSHP